MRRGGRALQTWLAAVFIRSVASSGEVIELFPALLPTQIAIDDHLDSLEYRLSFPASYSSSAKIIVTPECLGLSFTPPVLEFDVSAPVVTGVSVQATLTGSWNVEFTAVVVTTALSGDSEKALTSSTFIYNPSALDILSPTIAYAVGDERWSGVVLHNDSFDAPEELETPSALWSAQTHGFPSSVCGSADGDNALYFTALGDRSAVTSPLNLLGFTGMLHFFHAYGFEAVQRYDAVGSNLIACEQAEEGEEVVFAYLPNGNDPANESAWIPLYELPRLNTTVSTAQFTGYSIELPLSAMHTTAQFRWRQKNHSSFPIDARSGLFAADIVAASNDLTSIHGELGLAERELWRYRNLFDQWMLDDVRLEVRLDAPTFTKSNIDTVGYTQVSVMSPVPGSWVKAAFGDGSHEFPACEDDLDSAEQPHELNLALTNSGYIHAISCLVVNGVLVTSFPKRSPRIEVQAFPPVIAAEVNTVSGSIDIWTVQIQCTDCEFMRYLVIEDGSDNGPSFYPTCTFGTLVVGTSGEIAITFNARVEVVACGRSLLPSDIVASDALVVHPRAPIFSYSAPATTITGWMELIISPPGELGFGVVYALGSDATTLSCPGDSSSLSSDPVNITVKVFEVVRAISCCINSACEASEEMPWGPMDVQAVAPLSSIMCSPVEPRTKLVTLEPVTVDASVRYLVGESASDLTCATGIFYTEPVAVKTSTSVFAVSCLDGLSVSDSIEVPVEVDGCCSGRDSFTYASCEHVLLMEDDFTDCLSSSKWSKMTSQWGGSDVNGGVHADNAHCSIVDDTTYLDLEAHGDLYPGSTPVGKRATPSGLVDHTSDDMYLEWALDGISPPPCNQLERCPARRVGAAVSTSLKVNAGVLVAKLKPCSAFGTLTQVWWGSYESREEDGYTAQEAPFLPLWKSALYQSKVTTGVPLIVSSETTNAVGYSDDFVEVVMQWNASEGRANLYVDGQLVEKQQFGDWQSTDTGALSIGVWFPNSLAGAPLFSTCNVLVDQVRIFQLEITGGRWCELDSVQDNAVSCVSDSDCSDWVRSNCFMDIYEAICMRNTSLSTSDENLTADGAEESPLLDDSTNSSEATDSSSAYFCQFRMQPLAQTSVSTSDASDRNLGLDWSKLE